jgi:hypothetical protein
VSCFLGYLQSHDQVGNRAAGDPFVPAESVDDLLGPCSAVATPGYMDRVKPEVPRFDAVWAPTSWGSGGANEGNDS